MSVQMNYVKRAYASHGRHDRKRNGMVAAKNQGECLLREDVSDRLADASMKIIHVQGHHIDVTHVHGFQVA
jgi:hypothetical protein